MEQGLEHSACTPPEALRHEVKLRRHRGALEFRTPEWQPSDEPAARKAAGTAQPAWQRREEETAEQQQANGLALVSVGLMPD